MKSSDVSVAAQRSLVSHNARFGLILFTIYLVVYGGFVFLTAFAADTMAHPIAAFGGVNLAIVYGMVLIIAAFVLAMVYMVGCKPEAAGEGA